MKRTIVILMMMILGVSVPSLAQQTVKEETNYIEHMITRGETFASIAKKYGITEQQLRDTNPKYKTAYAGLKLRVPQQQATTQAPAPQPSQPQQASLSQQVSSPQPDTQPKQIAERAPISGAQNKFALFANTSAAFKEVKIIDTSGNTLYEDHFTSNNGKWQLGKDWSIENGTLTYNYNSQTSICINNTNLDKDYDIIVKAELLKGRGSIYVAINVKDKNNFDFVKLGSECAIKNYQNGRDKTIRFSTKGNFDIYYPNELKVCVRNGEIMICYINGLGAITSSNASSYFKKLAKKDDAEANLALGTINERGFLYDNKPYLGAASRYYKKAAEAGSAHACYLNGLCLQQSKKIGEAIEWFMKGINKGYAPAAFALADIYYKQDNEKEAAKYIAQAVELTDGIDEACRLILNPSFNFIYRYGYTNPVRTEFSHNYLEAVYAHDFAYYRLRKEKTEDPFYESTVKGHPLGCKYFVKLAEQGNKYAIKQYVTYLWTGSLKNIPQDKKKAIELCKRCLDEPICQQLLIIAKGSGLYSGDVEKEWYKYYGSNTPLWDIKKQEANNGNVEAAAILFMNSNRNYLTEMVKSGNPRAAQFMDESGDLSTSEVVALLSSAQKTKYDKYGKDINLLNNYYKNAYSIAAKGKFEEIDKSVINEREIKLYMDFYKEYPQYDKQNYRGKARKLLDFLQVNSFAVEDVPSPKKFSGHSSADNSWIGGCNYAISTCQSKNQDSRFVNFYKLALPILKKKKEIAQKNIDIARADYENAVAHEKYIKDNAVIDWDRCEEPSGKLYLRNIFVDDRILDGGSYEHLNNGTIRLKNGHYYKYNAIYDDRNNFLYYKVKSIIGEFKSKKEMIDAILKRER